MHFKVQFRKPPDKGYFTLDQDFDLEPARRWARSLREQGKKYVRILRVTTTTRTVW